MADYELSRGVTQICPAGMTLGEDQLIKICENAAAHAGLRTPPARSWCGLHLEGPFLCMAKKGAQNGACLHDPDLAMLRRLQKAANGLVKLVTVAAERPGAMEFIRGAVADGITVSLGHTDGGLRHRLRRHGRRRPPGCTHLFNAMPPFTHRAPGVVGAAFDHPATARWSSSATASTSTPAWSGPAVASSSAPERVILISDSLRATGMPDGRYTLRRPGDHRPGQPGGDGLR